jgi:hypothetical protein
LEAERLEAQRKLLDIKNKNQAMSREITRNKMFSKKDDEKKKKKEEKERILLDINDKNKEIKEHDIHLDRETRKLGDRNLLKKQ